MKAKLSEVSGVTGGRHSSVWGAVASRASHGGEEAGTHRVFARSFHSIWGGPSCLGPQRCGEGEGRRGQVRSARWPHRWPPTPPHFLPAPLNKTVRRCRGSPGTSSGAEEVGSGFRLAAHCLLGDECESLRLPGRPRAMPSLPTPPPPAAATGFELVKCRNGEGNVKTQQGENKCKISVTWIACENGAWEVLG